MNLSVSMRIRGLCERSRKSPPAQAHARALKHTGPPRAGTHAYAHTCMHPHTTLHMLSAAGLCERTPKHAGQQARTTYSHICIRSVVHVQCARCVS
eukprot:6192649-Pleurochrysis_carterae.AAC.1